jgi:Carboxypeptidase regulatory-like domain
MTISMIAASVFLVLQAATGSIQGVVISSAANKPIGGAQVTAVKLPSLPPVPNGGVVSAPERAIVVTGVVGGIVGGGTLTPGDTAGRIGAPVQIPPATTDTNGHFAFANLEAGAYLLRASADGYAQQEFNTRPGDQPGMSTQVTLSAGQAVNNAVLHLTPGGTVSGRVTGSNGEPIVNIEVSLLRRVYDITGRTNFQSAGLAQTNDRGEYRLFWVPPGKYYLSAASSNRPIPGVPFNPGGRGNKYPRTYYPATTDVAAAAMIDVQPAVELSGLDFRLTEQQTYRVRGRVVDPTSGQTPRAVSISIVPRNPIVNSGMSSSGSPYNPSDGTFELRDVPAGSYRIIAQVTNFAREPGQPFVTPPMATALVDVGGADVDGIVLTITPPISISGRIRVEGASSQSTLAASIMLRPASPGPVPAPLRPAQANAEGIFTLEGVPPGEYSVTVNAASGPGQQGTAYVKQRNSIRRQGRP